MKIGLSKLLGQLKLIPLLAGIALGSVSPIPNAQAASGQRVDCPKGIPSMTLRFGTNIPTKHYLSRQGDQVFNEAVEKLSCNRIKIQYFPSSQLGKAADMITSANSGVADIVAASPPYVSAQMPLANAFDLPQILPNADVGSRALYKVATDPKTEIYKNDFERNGLHFLYGSTLPLYQIVTVKVPIRKLSDIKGLQLRSAGGAQDWVVKALGAIPVAMPRNEDYEAFQRGTLDGGLFNLPSLNPNKVDEVTRYATLNANVTSFAFAVEISQKKWEQMTPAARTVITTAGNEAQASLSSHMVSDDREAIVQLRKEGMILTELPAAQIKEMQSKLEPVIQAWIDQMESQGHNGKLAVEEVKAAVRSVSR